MQNFRRSLRPPASARQASANGSFVCSACQTGARSNCRRRCRCFPLRCGRSSPSKPKASGRRVDLQIARIEVDALAKTYGLTNATRFIDLLQVAGISRTQREAGAAGTGGGFEVDFQIPIFDFGEVRVRRAGEIYMQAVNRLSELAVDARSEARDGYRAYRSSYDIAMRYRRDVLPLRKIIADEAMLRYGAMQIDVFALLTEARQRIAANIAAIEAQRDFWLASSELEAALIGGAAASDTAAGAPNLANVGSGD